VEFFYRLIPDKEGDDLQASIAWLHEFITHDFPLFHIGKTEITLGQLLSIVVGITVLFIASGWLRKLIANRLLAHGHVDLSTRYTIASLIRYVVLVFGVMAIMETAGINLTAFSVLAGAVGVGVGFGLQNIVSNFISGLIVMFERPVRIGDRIEMGGVEGNVVEIGARATRIMTDQRSIVIMPNQKFITDPVTNWAESQGRSSIVLNVIVDKESDPRKAENAIRSAIEAYPGIAKKAEMRIWLTGLAVNPAFRIIVPAGGDAEARGKIIHDLYFAIYEALAQAGIKTA